MPAGALSKIRVLDLTEDFAGGYCTKLLAGFGADVVKVERVGEGDPLRGVGAPAGAPNPLESSIPFLWLHTGKRSIALDPERDGETLRELSLSADVVVAPAEPRSGFAEALDPRALRAQHPGLIWVTLSPFGSWGPRAGWRASELVWYAVAGGMYLTGDPAREPLGPGIELAGYSAGQNAYLGILLALFAREHTGLGQSVEVSIHEASIENVEIALINYLRGGAVPRRAAHPMVPWDLYRARDGWTALTCAPFRHFPRAVELFEEPRLGAPEYRHIRDRAPRRSEVDALIQPWLSRHRREEIFEAGQKRGLAWGYLADLAEVRNSPQLAARGFFATVDHPVAGRHRYCGAPWRMSRTPWRDGRAPLLGEHGGEVRGEWLSAGNAEWRAGPVSRASARRAALEGVRVLDLSHQWAAPHATRLLADFGADVIRIEYRRRLCMFRGGRTDGEMYNRHAMWAQISRGKRSLTLDLHAPGDAQVLRELVQHSDVVVDNARGGVMERLGFSPAALRELRSDLIVASAPAFGGNGPYASYSGYGALFEAMGGLQQATGYSDCDKPVRVKEIDVTNGVAFACAILTALIHRQRTGQGQVVDCSQLELAIHSLFGEHLLRFEMTGERPRRLGNRHPRFAPQGCYPCRGEDRWLALTVRCSEEWSALCEALGRPEWADDPRYSTPAARRARHDEIDAHITAWSRTREHREAAEALQARGVPAGAVLDLEELAADPHLRERGFWRSAERAEDGIYPGVAIRLEAMPARIRWPGPALGEHDAELLCGLLGRPASAVRPIVPEELGTAFDPE